jgi:hypothetical protein
VNTLFPSSLLSTGTNDDYDDIDFTRIYKVFLSFPFFPISNFGERRDRERERSFPSFTRGACFFFSLKTCPTLEL